MLYPANQNLDFICKMEHTWPDLQGSPKVIKDIGKLKREITSFFFANGSK